MAVDAKNSAGTRGFAFLELFCFYVSMVTFVALFGQVCAAQFYDFKMLPFWSGIMQVLLAASVAYLTNWLAIEMLFKPYTPIPWLLFWRQGLVPRNKTKIGVQAGRKIASELLDPAAISQRLCRICSDFVESEAIRADVCDRVLNLLRTHEDSIAEYIVPEIEASVIRIIRQNVTTDGFRQFWDKEIAPRLASEEVRTFVTSHIVSGIKKQSPELVMHIRKWFHDYIRRYIDNNIGGLIGGLGADMFADGLTTFIDWNMVEKMLNQNLDNPKTMDAIKNALVNYVDDFHKWVSSYESTGKLNALAVEIQGRLRDLLASYLRTEMPKMTKSILISPKLWNWINEEFLPGTRPHLERLIQEKAPIILESVNFQEIISTAIDRQDIRDFHAMVDDVAAEHLGAIQVLGFFLGGIIGTLQLGL